MRKLPEPQDNQGRVETGILQFDKDWPGIFIRGDEAMGMAQDLKRIGEFIDDFGDTSNIGSKLLFDTVQRIKELFESCDTRRMNAKNT